MIQLDYSDHRPLYEQIKEKIKKLVISGVLDEDEQIPSVRELALTLAINPNTIQRAYRELEAEGYINSVRGKGSFVSGDISDPAKVRELKAAIKELANELAFLGAEQKELMDIIKGAYDD